MGGVSARRRCEFVSRGGGEFGESSVCSQRLVNAPRNSDAKFCRSCYLIETLIRTAAICDAQ
jgi:hypothetical protein